MRCTGRAGERDVIQQNHPLTFRKYMKYLLALFLSLASFSLNSEVVYQRDVKVTRLNAYDDVANVAAYIYLSKNHPDCPNGAYLNPGAAHLYSLLLAAFMSEKTVTFQLYNDRLVSGRCEVDAISVFN